ncbi:MAG: helix-turn-helix transcriptional regulator [Deltaproteobacteria bacterium]|nr:helix-turn-helix transcriptional regulator [Deltaproteobacteria bacterium]MBI3390941.1 helix-turn-helix transcriptional regulator [Deltaproteobacteria bacterium]
MSNELEQPSSVLAADRTFVVRLGATAANRLSGRVEHVWSGRAIEFDSPESLLSFILGSTRRPNGNAVTETRSADVTASAMGLVLATVGLPPPLKVTPARLQERFGLTVTEAMLASHLVAGSSLEKAAERLGIRRTVARSHLRQIFVKTGTNRQTALVQRLLVEL